MDQAICLDLVVLNHLNFNPKMSRHGALIIKNTSFEIHYIPEIPIWV
jgi:hypothetical protein